MSPLQIFRIFDYQQPNTGALGSRTASGINQTMATDAKSAAQDGSTFVDRRKMPDRRAGDRREKQHATFLNTRKTQGRRQQAGRRATDAEVKLDYKPISLKG
ncbi:MAG: hypothetical protein E6Q34_10680 [Burkholderiaceae bacterium]|nr:MAG: hypothetical protein E6Q34_10680 [Burkholderiaceae bacterium]